MRVPSYRKHSSGQARVTINGNDHLLGPYGSPESKEAYGRLIAEYNAAQQSSSFGKPSADLTLDDVLLAYLRHAKTAYRGKSRTIYVGPKAQVILAPYLLRAADSYCFSPAEAEQQRRAARTAACTTPPGQGNSLGTNRTRRPRKTPGTFYKTQSYGRAIRYPLRITVC